MTEQGQPRKRARHSRRNRVAVCAHVVTLGEALSSLPEADDAVGRHLDLLVRVVGVLYLVACTPGQVAARTDGRKNGAIRFTKIK